MSFLVEMLSNLDKAELRMLVSQFPLYLEELWNRKHISNLFLYDIIQGKDKLAAVM